MGQCSHDRAEEHNSTKYVNDIGARLRSIERLLEQFIKLEGAFRQNARIAEERAVQELQLNAGCREQPDEHQRKVSDYTQHVKYWFHQLDWCAEQTRTLEAHKTELERQLRNAGGPKGAGD